MIKNSVDNIEVQTPIMSNRGGMFDCVVYTDGKIIDVETIEDYDTKTFFVSKKVKTKNTMGINRKNIQISNASYVVLAYYTYKWFKNFKNGRCNGGGWEKVFSDVIIAKCDIKDKTCLKELRKVIKNVKYYEFPISDFGSKISFKTAETDNRICVLQKSKYRNNFLSL